ncbi:MAG TPA: glycosyltransferase [Terriglobales bacterium]|nr:glycosyltransferase [Terriglobales bacterium]
MKIVIFGLAITSSWGNGHATTYRALARALGAHGHRIIFFECNQEWYASNRDLPEPDFCRVRIYEKWDEVLPAVREQLRDCDVAMVGSYFPDATQAIEEVFASKAGVKAFYDIDTPITVAQLRSGGAEYLKPEQVPGFDIYFSFTGGPMLQELESRFGARAALPLYCSFDPAKYRFASARPEYTCDFSYMGTYAPDRQAKIEELFCAPARRLPDRKFLLAGPQYPEELCWPRNVRQIIHIEPRFHASFYSSSRMTLNVTRREMVLAGYSPSVRLFEAAACGSTIVSDNWAGLETFLEPGEEILLPRSSEEVVRYLLEMDESEIRRIGRNAQQRVLAEHTSEHRAEEFERYVDQRPVKNAVATSSTGVEKLSTASR